MFLLLSALLLLTGCVGAPWTEVSFDDLAPAGIDMRQCWNAMGMDDRGRIYIGFTSARADGREDFAVFRYDPQTRERTFLGTCWTWSPRPATRVPAKASPRDIRA